MECHICGLRLSAKQALDQHIRTHTNEQPYKCQYGCGRTFKQHSALSEDPQSLLLPGALMTQKADLEQQCTTGPTQRKSLSNATSVVLCLRNHRTSASINEPTWLGACTSVSSATSTFIGWTSCAGTCRPTTRTSRTRLDAPSRRRDQRPRISAILIALGKGLRSPRRRPVPCRGIWPRQLPRTSQRILGTKHWP